MYLLTLLKKKDNMMYRFGDFKSGNPRLALILVPANFIITRKKVFSGDFKTPNVLKEEI